MKLIPLYLFLFAFIFTSCDYTEDYYYAPEYVNPIPNPLQDTIGDNVDFGEMKAIVNGESWSSDSVWAQITGGRINITGQNTDGGTQILLVANGTSPQTYNLDNSSTSHAYYTDQGITYFNFSGNMVISEINEADKLISGTFVFDASESGGDSRTVTNGIFTNVRYFGDIQTENLMSVEIDNSGQTWSPEVITATLANSQIKITGSTTSGSLALEIYLPENVMAPSQNPLDSVTAPKARYISSGSEFVSKSGNVNISVHDFSSNQLTGTFYFDAGVIGSPIVDHTLTSGSFTVTYTE